MKPENRPLSEREPKRPSWNAALLSGRATLGGATKFGEWFAITAGTVVVIVALYLLLKLL